MNLLDAKLVKVDGKYAVELDGYTVELSEEKQAKLAANNVEEQEIVLGIRPDHLELAENGLETKIEVTELMGSSVQLHVTIAGKDVIVVVPTLDLSNAELAAMSAGTPVKVGFPSNACHVFCKETKINLEA
jgi:multiple sugar transport system ATP-binding protein